jgi:hypothetical protein
MRLRCPCVWLLVAVVQTCALAAKACSICGCGDPLASAAEARLMKGQLRLALDTELLTARARSDDDPAFVERVTQYTVRPVLAFSPIDVLTLVLQIPVIRKDWSATAAGEAPMSARPTGLGDIDLAARAYVYTNTRLVQMSRETLALTAGTSLPTGENSVQVEGVRVDEHAQLGTGALGPYAGVLYAFRRDPWNFFGSVTGRVRLRNGYGYKYGSALLWSLRGDYRLVDWLSAGVSFDGRFAERDDRHGVLQTNTGGLVLAAAPGVKLRVHEELWLYGIVQIPVVTHLFGEQRVGPVFTASLQYTFQ